MVDVTFHRDGKEVMSATLDSLPTRGDTVSLSELVHGGEVKEYGEHEVTRVKWHIKGYYSQSDSARVEVFLEGKTIGELLERLGIRYE